MAGTNNFLPFGTGSSPNVIDDATYNALAARGTGFQSGVAQAQQLNKVWRQSSVMSAVLGQIIANNGVNASDSDTVATLVTNLLAAIHASPALTGNPVAPTPAQFDSDTSIATTAFVQGVGARFTSLNSFNASKTIAASEAGTCQNFFGNSAATATLPTTASVPAGTVIAFDNAGTGVLTVSRQSTDVIYQAGVSNTSITLKQGDTMELVATGGSWTVFGGSAALTYSNVWFNNPVGIGGSPTGFGKFLIEGPANNGRFYADSNALTYTIDSNDATARGKSLYFRYCGSGSNRAKLQTDGELGFMGGSYTATLEGGSTFYSAFFCRAWVNFNGSTSGMRGYGNMSSVTRNSTGNYTCNFASALPDTNYAAAGMCYTANNNFGYHVQMLAMNTGSLQILADQEGGGAAAYDNPTVMVSIHR